MSFIVCCLPAALRQVNLLLSTVAISRETNKQLQLQKQAQNKPNIFFWWFIIINIIY